MEIVVTVAYEVFANISSNWGVYSLKSSKANNKTVTYPQEISSVDDIVSFTGVGPILKVGVKHIVSGDWTHGKRGLQFQIADYSFAKTETEEETIKFLASGLFKEVGTATAKKIYKHFGTESVNIIQYDPERLAEVKGLSKRKLEKIISSVATRAGYIRAYALLKPYGFNDKQIAKISEKYAFATLETDVKDNPYALCRINGVTFPMVDSFALRNDFCPTSYKRIEEIILFIVKSVQFSGNLYIEQSLLIDEVLKYAKTPSLNGNAVIHVLKDISQNQIIRVQAAEEIHVYSCHAMKADVIPARKIASLLSNPIRNVPMLEKEIDNKITNLEYELSTTLDEEQRQAIKLALCSKVSIITGGAGTGKTTILNFILKIYEEMYPNKEFALLAPTGRAAQRMRCSTGQPSYTLHSRLKFMNNDNAYYPEDNISSDASMLSEDLIVIDESSMMDSFIFLDLMEKISVGSQLVLIGDYNQLPSVSAGSVLKQLIDSNAIPTSFLKKIFRQDNLDIVENAQAILNGNTRLKLSDMFTFKAVLENEGICNETVQAYFRDVALYGIKNVAILCPTRKERGNNTDFVCSEKMNSIIRNIANPDKSQHFLKIGNITFREGDRVMQTMNIEIISNGDVGTIISISPSEETITVNFDDGEDVIFTKESIHLTLAYAMSVHKSQGSEYSSVIIPIASCHGRMLRRNLLYTAVTRAKAKTTLIGHGTAVAKAILTPGDENRKTHLGEFVLSRVNKIKTKKGA